jgi:hypothetical protein
MWPLESFGGYGFSLWQLGVEGFQIVGSTLDQIQLVDLDLHLSVDETHRVGSHACPRVGRGLARAQLEAPGVQGAEDLSLEDVPFRERTAAVRAAVVEGEDLTAELEESNLATPHGDADTAALGQVAEGSHGHERHVSST